jgi:hypothetical protein
MSIYSNSAACSILLPFSKNKNLHRGVALFLEKKSLWILILD